MDEKTIELAIMLNAPKWQVQALKATLSPEQLEVYKNKLIEIRDNFIKDKNITDERLLNLLREQLQ